MSSKKVAIISHDAGGAEILSSWLRRSNEDFLLSVDGPALKIFNKKIPGFKNYNLHEAIKSSDWVLCGSSFLSNLEREAILLSKEYKKKCIVFLDHWVNYQDRFFLDGFLCLPDEIWVGDRKAKEIAQNFFPTLSIKLKKNPYFEDVKSQVKTVRSKIGNKKYTSILYVTEPISNWAIHNHGNEHYLGYTEKTALLFFMDNTHKMGFKNPIVRIKLHPSEPVGKYDEIIKKSKLNISVSKGKDLINEINKSDIVIGCNTMALVVALLLKKRVFCSIPVSGIPHPLPFSRIKYIRDLVNAS